MGIIRQGRLMDIGSVEDLRARHVHRYTVTLDSEELASAFARDFSGTRQGRTVTVTSKQSLEEIFLHYYGGEAK